MRIGVKNLVGRDAVVIAPLNLEKAIFVTPTFHLILEPVQV